MALWDHGCGVDSSKLGPSLSGYRLSFLAPSILANHFFISVLVKGPIHCFSVNI
jgi:hypothetical protein